MKTYTATREDNGSVLAIRAESQQEAARRAFEHYLRGKVAASGPPIKGDVIPLPMNFHFTIARVPELP